MLLVVSYFLSTLFGPSRAEGASQEGNDDAEKKIQRFVASPTGRREERRNNPTLSGGPPPSLNMFRRIDQFSMLGLTSIGTQAYTNGALLSRASSLYRLGTAGARFNEALQGGGRLVSLVRMAGSVPYLGRVVNGIGRGVSVLASGAGAIGNGARWLTTPLRGIGAVSKAVAWANPVLAVVGVAVAAADCYNDISKAFASPTDQNVGNATTNVACCVIGGVIGACLGGPLGAAIGIGLGNLAADLLKTYAPAVTEFVGTAVNAIGSAVSSVASTVSSWMPWNW